MKLDSFCWLAWYYDLLVNKALSMAEEGPVVIRNQSLEVRADRKTGEITILAKGKPVVFERTLSPREKAPKVVPLRS